MNLSAKLWRKSAVVLAIACANLIPVAVAEDGRGLEIATEKKIAIRGGGIH